MPNLMSRKTLARQAGIAYKQANQMEDILLQMNHTNPMYKYTLSAYADYMIRGNHLWDEACKWWRFW